MKVMPKKIFIAAGFILAAVAFLASAGVRKGWTYYVTADQFNADAKYRTERVKICGTVAPEGFDVHRGLLTANFRIAGQGQAIPVVYHGAIPDMFRQGAEVVVGGKMNESGVFVADDLLTKCASKYDSQAGPAPGAAAMPAGHPTPSQRPS